MPVIARYSRVEQAKRIRRSGRMGMGAHGLLAAKEGLLALSVGVGLAVLHEVMEAEVVRHEALSDRTG
jgi:hypothetical protein